MKRIYLIFMVISMLILGSCSLQSDEAKCKGTIDDIVKCLNEKDEEALKGYFSEYAVSQCSNLDKDIENLFNYYDGVSSSVYKWGNTKSTHKDNGKTYINFSCSYDITTDKGVYRLAVSIYTTNQFEPNKVGIESLYLLNKDNDINKDIAYHGDGLWTPGINIGKVMIENEI